MLNNLIADRAVRLIEVEFEKRRKSLSLDMGKIKADLAQRGMSSSSAAIDSLDHLFSRELEIRSIIAWQNIVRAHQNNGSPISSGLRDDLKQEVNKYICQAFDELTSSLQRELQSSGLKGLPPTPHQTLADTKIREIKKHDVEIDLYIDSLEQKATSKPLLQNYNFYGNIGALQTGANATANIFQNLNENDKSAIKDAMQQARNAIQEDAELAPDQKKEIIEITNECEAQINSGHPNNTKLLTLLTVLGTTVQSIASAPTAYNSLKAALLPLGISLP